jgi:micrococcal nuclease
MRAHSLTLIFLLVFLLSAFSQSKGPFLPVSKVVDGDTFWVMHPNGQEEKIRLIGVDSPEARRTGRTEIEYFGKESSEFAKKKLAGRRVRLEFDVQRYDRYRRTLAYVYLEDGTFFNALLVKEGYATVATFPPNVKFKSTFLKLEQEARSRKKGLWNPRANWRK